MNPYFSIIMTAYNTPSNMLHKCMSSWLHQSCKDFELILIDDGSDKKTKKIFSYYQKRMPMLRIIEQAHKGPSAGRNAGLEVARGKFIYLADSDDYVSEYILEKLKICAVNHPELDMIYFDYLKSNYRNGEFCVVDDREVKFENAVSEMFFMPTAAKEIIVTGFLNEMKNFYHQKGQCWTMVVRRDIVEKNHLRFKEKLRIAGDAVFHYSCIVYAENMAYLPEPLYFYVYYNENNITNKFNSDSDKYLLLHLKEVKKYEPYFLSVFKREFPFYIIKTYAKNMKLHYFNNEMKFNSIKTRKQWKRTTEEYKRLFGISSIGDVYNQKKTYGILAYSAFKLHSYFLTKLAYRLIEKI